MTCGQEGVRNSRILFLLVQWRYDYIGENYAEVINWTIIIVLMLTLNIRTDQLIHENTKVYNT